MAAKWFEGAFGVTGKVIKNNPKAATAVGSTAVGSVGLFAAVPLVLGGFGFTAAGPALGSAAAAWQSSMGIVQAGSLFSALQGAAMGGTAATGVGAAAGGIGAAVGGAVGGAINWIKR